MQSTVEVGAGSGKFPAILQLPENGEPAGAALLLHGFTARKEEMANSIGQALAGRGIATLAPDLPLHGARAGHLEGFSLQNPVALLNNWRQALAEARWGIDYLNALAEVDSHRIAIIGYSLGAYLSTFAAADDDRIAAIALVAGGDLPASTPFASIVRTIANPCGAVKKLGGRPLLMMNGTRDRVVLPAQAKLLFEAAEAPKELRWYDGPHWPPASVINDVADWVANRLAARPLAPDAPRGEPGDSSRSPRLRRAS
jgi:fermentation-respiration switch protein FrsA (DUF1100 family)